jgi:hypothetical protein
MTTTADASPAPWAFSGYIDASYTHNNRLNNIRVFDHLRQGIVLNQIGLTLKSAPTKGLGGNFTVIGGNDANITSSFGSGLGSDTGTSGGNADRKFDIEQAFLTYAQGPYTITGGKFVTFAGQEVIDPTGNWNYSRSILFGAIPFTHTGARLTYNNSKMWNATIGVNNGWDQVTSSNDDHTIEAQIALMPSDKLSIYANGYFGNALADGFTGSANGQRSLVDLVASYTLSPQTTIAVNYDDFTQKNASTVDASGNDKAKYNGFAGYIHHVINPKWGVTLRAETFDDKDGYHTGTIQRLSEETLTLSYIPAKNTEIRLEGRQDQSNQQTFTTEDGGTSKNGSTVGAEVIVKF